jgi:uncharacterized protein (TIGR02246 family)
MALSVSLLLVIGASVAPGRVNAQTAVTLEDRIAALEAQEAIRQLIYAYGAALDHRDFVAFSELFAEDSGTWVGGFGTATGRQAIFEMMDASIGHAEEPIEPGSHHVFTNVQIEVDGAHATATTKWIFVVPSESGDPRWMFLGHYDDEFVREDGRWYFLRREAFTDIPAQ